LVGLLGVIFTFGLSVPFGAALGTGIGGAGGVCLGTATGAVVGGGSASVGYAYRKEIVSAAKSTSEKVMGARPSTGETAETIVTEEKNTA